MLRTPYRYHHIHVNGCDAFRSTKYTLDKLVNMYVILKFIFINTCISFGENFNYKWESYYAIWFYNGLLNSIYIQNVILAIAIYQIYSIQMK